MGAGPGRLGRHGGPRTASRTAVLVCQGRAAADGRLAPGVFSDPVAVELLTYDERAVVEQVRDEAVPKGWSERLAYEAVRACAEVMVPRTVAIDDALRAHPNPQLVVLGAGLDARGWRMEELAGRDVWEVDHPASQHDKRERLGDREPLARLRFTPVDFATDDLGAALGAAGHRADLPTTWLWEGVVPYLTEDQVSATLSAVGALSAAGSALVVNYQAPSRRALVGRLLARIMSGRGGGPFAIRSEPWHTLLTPEQFAALVGGVGFDVRSDENLAAAAGRLALPLGRRGSSTSGRVAVAVLPS